MIEQEVTCEGDLFLCVMILPSRFGSGDWHFFPYMNRQMGPQSSISEHIMAPSNSAAMKLRQFGIFLAPILNMKKLMVLLFIFVAANPHVMFAQKDSTENAKQRRAGQVADRFVNRFRATLDFGMAWKAFRLSDPSCTHRANGILNQSDYERLKLNSRTIEKLYIATMNSYYLKSVHELSLARIDSQSDSDDSLTPNEVKVIEKRSKFFQNDDRKLQNAKEVGELISTFDQLSALYRKDMPAGAMKSPAWRANQKYLIASSGMDHGGALNGDATFCVPQKTKVYIVDRGLFYFYVVEEGRKMKVAGLGID